jgi:hypothetical protein
MEVVRLDRDHLCAASLEPSFDCDPAADLPDGHGDDLDVTVIAVHPVPIDLLAEGQLVRLHGGCSYLRLR